jgi:hypothetical protein
MGSYPLGSRAAWHIRCQYKSNASTIDSVVTTYPALVADALWTLATKADANDVRRGVEQSLGELDELLVAHFFDELIDSHSVHQLAIADGRTIGEGDLLLSGVDLDNLALLTVHLLLGGQSIGDGDPDTTGTIASWEPESGVGTPTAGSLVQDDVLGDSLEVRGGDTLAEPLCLHLYRNSSVSMDSQPSRGHG